MPSQTQTIPQQVDAAFLFIVAISTFLLVVITALMIYFVLRYHHTRNPTPTDIEGNLWLEIAWTAIPVVIVLMMFWYGFRGFSAMRNVPKDAMIVKCTAMMWRWSFQYENGIQADVLRVPWKKPVKVLIHSNDVLHSLYIPAFRVKQDAVPGRETFLWFEPTSMGNFDILCAEYCGIDHSKMLSKVIVMPPEDFAEWYASEAPELVVTASGESEAEEATPLESVATGGEVEPAEPEETADGDATLVATGESLAGKKGCFACHSRDGTPMKAPSFKGLFGRKATVLVDGKEEQRDGDETYIRRAINNPADEIVKGFQPLMPPPNLSDDELEAVMAYLRTLN